MKCFTLPIRLPGINEYQNACRRHPLQGSAMKKQATQQVMTYLTPVTHLKWPAQFDVVYTEPNKRRDIDNIIGFGSKVILDAFVKAGFLPDDGPSYVNKITSQVEYGTEPMIEIYVKERGDDTWADIEDIDKLFEEAVKLSNEMGLPNEPILPQEPKTKRKKK